MDSPRRALRNLHINNLQKHCTPLKIPASPFMKTLGYGTGVNVYRLELSPKCGNIRSPIAVKRVSRRLRQNGELFNQRIQKEAEVLRKLSHPNIVGYRGMERTVDGLNALALECCTTSLGDILEEMREQDKGPLAAKLILRMISDISNALDYLHTKAKLLHGDIKSYNVLVKDDFAICKLCDFGVSLPLDEQGEIDFSKRPHLRYVGTNLWLAPEIIDELPVIDGQADIFSFGLVIYETIALQPPHMLEMDCSSNGVVPTKSTPIEIGHLANEGEESFDESLELKENVDKSCEYEEEEEEGEGQFDEEVDRFEHLYGTRPPLPQAFKLNDEYNCVVELFYCCTNELPEDRPTAKAIFQSLQARESDEKE